MSAAARGAAGYLYAKGRMRGRERQVVVPPDAMREAEQHLRRFVRDPARARELAAEAVKVTVKRRKFLTAP